MSVLIQVDYGLDYPIRAAIISGFDEEPFVQFAQSNVANGKEGEELIELIITHLSSNIKDISRYCGKAYEDGPQGQPHKQHFSQGRLTKVEHYRNDLRNDSSKGEPALQVYNWKGQSSQLKYSARYKEGLKHNGANGEPSVQSFNDEGTLTWQISYQNNQLSNYLDCYPASAQWHGNGQPKEFQWVDGKGEYHDPSGGNPAIQKWDSEGQEVYRANYTHGKRVHELVSESRKEKELDDFRDNQILLAKQSCPALNFKADLSLLRVGSI